MYKPSSKKKKKSLERIDYIFCSDVYLLNINKTFLHHDFFTDILTFNLSDSSHTLKSEVYISIDRVKENALIFKVPKKEELLRVIIHGALHLCGYNDKTKKEVKLMRNMENYYLLFFKTQY